MADKISAVLTLLFKLTPFSKICKLRKKAYNNRTVPKVLVGENEPLERALRRLKKKIEREGILKILRARKHYEKPSEKRRRKIRSNKKRKFY